MANTGLMVMVNRPYPRRVQLVLGTLIGPLKSLSLGAFDPRRDLQIYNGGTLLTIESVAWDGPANRYLMFLTTDLNFDAVTQVIHHAPTSPFRGQLTTPVAP